MKKVLLVCLFFLSLYSWGEIYQNEELQYRIDLLPDWTVYDHSDVNAWSFRSGDQGVVLEVSWVSKNRYNRIEDLYNEYIKALQPRGESSPFTFNRQKSYLADFTYLVSGQEMRGYFLFFPGRDGYFVLKAFTFSSMFELKQDIILSVLNGFAFTSIPPHPGPMSQAFFPYPAPNDITGSLVIGGRSYQIPWNSESFRAAQEMVEGEAAILAALGENFHIAWERYYRVIYWDNYAHLENLGMILKNEWAEIPDIEKVQQLVTWVQDFAYVSSGTLSDLIAPLVGAYTQKGDCDTRALLLMALLDYLDIESILMVSSEYSHSMIAIDIPAEGARVAHQGKSYLIVETTERVAMGLIGSKVADPAKWQTMKFVWKP